MRRLPSVVNPVAVPAFSLSQSLVLQDDRHTTDFCPQVVRSNIKVFNPLKLFPVSGNMLRKWFASYFLFIYKHLLIYLNIDLQQ